MEAFLLPRDAVNSLIGMLRCSGCRITQARRAVIETLASEAAHLTAPGLVEAVQKRAPGVGRASVYRTLGLLTRLGLVQTSTLGGGVATYVLAPSGHHHHVVCIECQKTVEFDECMLEELEQRLAEALGFQFEGHLVELYGRCPDCLSH
jgi:Fur family ferric uptake transcriptional regulator